VVIIAVIKLFLAGDITEIVKASLK